LPLIEPLHPFETAGLQLNGTINPELHNLVQFLQANGTDQSIHCVHCDMRRTLAVTLLNYFLDSVPPGAGLDHKIDQAQT
jgi:hypothetical protein